MLIKLNNENLNDLLEIENTCFSHPQTKENLEISLNNDKYLFIGYKINNLITGYGSVFITEDEAYINDVAVIDKYRNQGIATKIVDKLISDSKNKSCSFITLEVRESNLPAINLYKKLGFSEVCKRKNYYNKPIENAIIMTKYFGDKNEDISN